MSKSTGELNSVLFPLSAAYLGVGLTLAAVGYGFTPLLVTAGVTVLLRGVYSRIENTGSPLGGGQ